MAGGHLLNDLHHHQVLIHLTYYRAEHRGELILVRSNLSVAGDEGDSNLEALLLNLLHGVHSGTSSVDGSHVVVGSLLPAGRQLAHDGAASHLEIKSAKVSLTGDEEELLLQSNVVHHTGDGDSQVLEETDGGFGHALDRSVERNLLIESLAIKRAEAGRDKEGITTKKNGGFRVNSEVCSGSMGCAHAAVRVGRTIGLGLQ
mmetsp:Transcript_1538/g.2196  ORF Transcript_1538/g.2196 Transcript_1538/m.2196 type:complete len:202 (-) Transcript_1538:646-1251(-)